MHSVPTEVLLLPNKETTSSLVDSPLPFWLPREAENGSPGLLWNLNESLQICWVGGGGGSRMEGYSGIIPEDPGSFGPDAKTRQRGVTGGL